MPAQILICVDENLQIGDCTYECFGAWPPNSSCVRRTQHSSVSQANLYMNVTWIMMLQYRVSTCSSMRGER